MASNDIVAPHSKMELLQAKRKEGKSALVSALKA